MIIAVALYMFFMTLWFVVKWHVDLDQKLVEGYFAQWGKAYDELRSAAHESGEAFDAALVKCMAWDLFFAARQGGRHD